MSKLQIGTKPIPSAKKIFDENKAKKEKAERERQAWLAKEQEKARKAEIARREELNNQMEQLLQNIINKLIDYMNKRHSDLTFSCSFWEVYSENACISTCWLDDDDDFDGRDRLIPRLSCNSREVFRELPNFWKKLENLMKIFSAEGWSYYIINDREYFKIKMYHDPKVVEDVLFKPRFKLFPFCGKKLSLNVSDRGFRLKSWHISRY